LHHIFNLIRGFGFGPNNCVQAVKICL
jgi:hypothetical protein